MWQGPLRLEAAAGLWSWTRIYQKRQVLIEAALRWVTSRNATCQGEHSSQMDEATGKNKNITVFPNMLLSKNLVFP